MATNIPFDSNQNPVLPTLVLARKDGSKYGVLPAESLVFKKCLNAKNEMVFKVRKMLNGQVMHLWDELRDFKLLWAKEWDLWFEIYVEIDELDSMIKTVTAVSLGEAELSQILLFGVEINTEDDILRDDFEPTVFYDPDNPEASLLDRVLSKAPHYDVRYVATSLMTIQRTFHFHDISIYSALQEVANELNCLIDYSIHSDENGIPVRTISVYDLESYCLECRHRGNFLEICPECGSDSVWPGYGEDTRIYISTKNLADEISFSNNVDSVKNCFRLEAGDELMTATIVNCNPNGSNYIYYISDELKKDMPSTLVDRLAEYDVLYDYYEKEHVFAPSSSVILNYNELVESYKDFHPKLSTVISSYTGFPDLMNVYYDTIDFSLFLEHSLMPSAEMDKTDAFTQAGKIYSGIPLSIAVYDTDIVSATTVDNAVLLYAKMYVDHRYQVKIKSGSYDANSQRWTGVFTVTNYYDDTDTADTETVHANITDNYFQYVSQIADRTLKDASAGATDIVTLFSYNDEMFKYSLKRYSLERLNSFFEASEASMNILIEQNAGTDIWNTSENGDLYRELYLVYRRKQSYIGDEIRVREAEIAVITALQNEIIKEISEIQKALHFEDFLGEELWKVFSSYRREDSYVNSNYISDGLSNTELIANAREFLDTAKKDIYTSAVLQHSISATLKNLLAMREFRGLTDYFDVGNWIHIRCDDKIHHLRLLEYEIDFDDLTNISVIFSDIQNTATGMDDTKSVQEQADSLMSSYDEISRQAGKGNDGKNILDNWTLHGLDLTHLKIISSAENQEYIFDEHGMVFRKYQPMVGTYSDEQLKIVNSTIAMTDNNWESVRTAIGAIYYIDPVTGELKYAYGVNGEVVIGKLILGEQLGIYNSSASMVFDKEGLKITNTNVEEGEPRYTFAVNPNGDNLLVISKENSDSDDDKIFWVDKNGKLYIRGNGSGLDISTNETITEMDGTLRELETNFTVTAEGIKAEMTELRNKDTELSNTIKATAEELSAELNKKIEDVDANVTKEYQSVISATAEEIKTELNKVIKDGDDAVTEAYKTAISETAEGINVDISEMKGGIATNSAGISANAKAITSHITNHEENISSMIKQEADSILQQVNNTYANRVTALETKDGEIEASIKDIEGNYAKVSAEIDEVSSTVSDHGTAISTIRQNANSITTRVGNMESQYTKLRQDVDSIDLSTFDGQEIVSRINLSEDGVKIDGDKIEISADSIDLHGYVTANKGFKIDLEGNMYAPKIYGNDISLYPSSLDENGSFSIYGYYSNVLRKMFSISYYDGGSAPYTNIYTYGVLNIDSGVYFKNDINFNASGGGYVEVRGAVDFSNADVKGLASGVAKFG